MERIGHYLADVCREVREQQGANRSVIAAQFNTSEWTVRRFEMQTGKWSAQTDELIAAYAHLAGIEPVDLWQRAIDRWKAAAQPEADVPQGAAVERMQDAAAQARQKLQSENAAEDHPPAKGRHGGGS